MQKNPAQGAEPFLNQRRGLQMADPDAPEKKETPGELISSLGACEFCGLPGSAACCGDGHHACDVCLAVFSRGLGKVLPDPLTDSLCPGQNCWLTMTARRAERGGPNLVQLPPDAPEYKDLVSGLRRTLPRAQIDKIFIVRNRGLWEAWKMCRASLKKRGSPTDERLLYHATWRASAGSIARSGFDIRLSGAQHGQALGRGIYVAANASFAHQYAVADRNGALCMVVARALLGAVETPQDSASAGRGKRFKEIRVDTFGGGNGDQYAVRREQQLYPMYIVYYDYNA